MRALFEEALEVRALFSEPLHVLPHLFYNLFCTACGSPVGGPVDLCWRPPAQRRRELISSPQNTAGSGAARQTGGLC